MIAADQPRVFDGAKAHVVVSSKADGNTRSLGDADIAEVSSNLEHIAHNAGFSFDSIVNMNVGARADVWDEIVDITEPPKHALISLTDRVVADALATTRTDVVIMLSVADCNAVAIHDPVHQVLAVAHLGWQSTAAELATKIVVHLQHKYQSMPADLKVYFSPSIRAESYIFDTVSQGDDPDWKPFLHRSEKGIGIDLPGYNRMRFIEAGVSPDNIEMSPVNTATSDAYFSHYRAVRSGEPDGRLALFGQLLG